MKVISIFCIIFIPYILIAQTKYSAPEDPPENVSTPIVIASASWLDSQTEEVQRSYHAKEFVWGRIEENLHLGVIDANGAFTTWENSPKLSDENCRRFGTLLFDSDYIQRYVIYLQNGGKVKDIPFTKIGVLASTIQIPVANIPPNSWTQNQSSEVQQKVQNQDFEWGYCETGARLGVKTETGFYTWPRSPKR